MRGLLVTGGAGFIGSNLCRRLLADGHDVTVLDDLAAPRQRRAVEALSATATRRDALRVVAADLFHVDLVKLLADVDVVVHLAGRPGVQTSWGAGFADHLRHNVEATQRLLEAALDAPVRRVVVASSSSVYGEVATGAASEDRPPSPVSPYGVAKAAVELLVRTYAGRGVPAVALRYFTVYGRAQRPDMAVHRMIEASLGGPVFERRGDGSQRRDLTHVDDVVEATVRAATRALDPGTVLNVGSGRPVSIERVLREVAELTGRPVPVEPANAAAGDPARTAADLTRVATHLGWSPSVDLVDGLRDQVEWHRSLRRHAVVSR